jgi:hypothetical protein
MLSIITRFSKVSVFKRYPVSPRFESPFRAVISVRKAS